MGRFKAALGRTGPWRQTALGGGRRRVVLGVEEGADLDRVVRQHAEPQHSRAGSTDAVHRVRDQP